MAIFGRLHSPANLTVMSLLSPPRVLTLLALISFATGQVLTEDSNKLFNVDDEPSNLCTGEFMGQLSCNRASNVVQNDQNRLELLASINHQARESSFLFNGAKMFTEAGWTSGKALVRVRQPTGRFLRSMIGLRTLGPNGVDWDRQHSSSIVFHQQTDTLLYKVYDRNKTATSTQLWSKKVRRFKSLQAQFANYSVEWSPDGRVTWSVNGHVIESHVFAQPGWKWHLVIQLGVGGSEFTELRDLLPDSRRLNWPNPRLTIDQIILNVGSITSSSQSLPENFLLFSLIIFLNIQIFA